MDPASGALTSIDYVIVIAYMLGVLGIGTYFAKYVHSAGDFFIGGKSLPFWAVGMSIVVSDIGAGALLVLCLWETGGWNGMSDTILELGETYRNHFTLLLPHDADTPYPWTGIVFGLGIVMSTAYFVGNQAVVQRVLGARTE